MGDLKIKYYDEEIDIFNEVAKINEKTLTVTLDKIPSSRKMIIKHGYTTLTEVEEEPNVNEYQVDRSTGTILFNLAMAGERVIIDYSAIGKFCMSADKVFTNVDSKGNVIETLEEFLQKHKEIIDSAETVGDGATILNQLEAHIESAKSLTGNIIEGGTLNDKLVSTMNSARKADNDLQQGVETAQNKINEMNQWVDKHSDIVNLDNRVDNVELSIPKINEQLETIGTDLNNLYISVKEFGAKGDGIVDDTQALKNTFDYCIRNKKRVFIPDGIYNCSETLNITRGLQVKGTGINSIIKYTGTDTLLHIIEQGDGSTWDDLNIGFKIDGLHLEGTDKTGTGILLNIVYKGYIDNCIVTGFNDGITITRGWCHFISRCRIEKNLSTGIYLKSIKAGYLNAITIDKNIIEYNGVGVKIGSGELSVTDTYLLGGNTIYLTHNTIQMNENEQIEINEFMQVTINDNYLEASSSNISKIISIGTKGMAIPKQIYILRNTMSKYTDFTCTPIYISKIDTGIIEGNTFWTAKDSIDIVIDENNTTNCCYISPTNKKNIGTTQLLDCKINDTDYMTYSKREVPLLLQNGWKKNSVAELIYQNMDMIQLKGQIQIDNLTNNVIGNLPYRFRPSETLRFISFVDRENSINYDCSYVAVYIRENGNIDVWSAITQNGGFSTGTKLVVDLNNISYFI